MFLNGDQIFPAMLASIRSAKQTVDFESYIYWSGDIGHQFADALAERARAGVKVRVLLDWMGSHKMDQDHINAMGRAGVEIMRYHQPHWYHVRMLNNRTHRKILVVDGAVGFTGGVGIADQWSGNAQDADHWRDIMFKITGPLARRLQSAFVDTWVSSSGEILVGPDIYPISSAGASGSIEEFISLPNSPADDEQSMAYFFLLPIMAARHSVYLGSPYFMRR